MLKTYLLVNFGGPRHLDEIAPFLKELLCDKDVIRTRLPQFAHDWLFRRVARKRALKVRHDYELIGGKSPIYFDTESIAEEMRKRVGETVLTFHRYLPETHQGALKKIEDCKGEIVVLPLFPQFTYATTGSIARFFQKRLKADAVNRLRWIKSYAAHPAFVKSFRKKIADFLTEQSLQEEETALLFSAHGVPQSFVNEGDIYESECQISYGQILKGFPKALGRLSYQSKFGPEEWIKPYTDITCEKALEWLEGRKNVVMVPLSFTSDHIETLFEIEKLYLPILSSKGLNAFRCPALNLEPYWIESLTEIAAEKNFSANRMLVRS